MFPLRLITVTLLITLAANHKARASADCVQALAACPDKPNCMSTNDPSPAHRFPELKVAAKDPENAWATVKKAVLGFERATVVTDKPGYLHVSIESAVFGFVDDLEVTQCKQGQTLSVRSASRTGYWDMGVNSSRIETLVDKLRETGTVR